ncbi:MAG: aspartate carbamoyltransferase [Thermoprotei archaeon]|jgi:aspartate carbamoyltransferase catalytic subunit
MRCWTKRDVISVLDFKKDELEYLFSLTDKIIEEKIDAKKPLDGKIVATAFFEPSTRTRLSFETAAHRLGASVITLEPSISSLAKGESFADTMRMLDSYADVIVMRSPLEGAAKLAAEICEHPVINGGDGTQHHPTQAMIDIYTIKKIKGDLRDLTIGVLGDLKYGRAATSFMYGVSIFGVEKLWLISPKELMPRDDVLFTLKRFNVELHHTENINDIIGELDVLYVTRIQKERFPDPAEYERVRGTYQVDLKLLSKAKNSLIVMHPLPRVDEISYEVDTTNYAAYFKEASYGVPLRMALLMLIMGVYKDV